MSIESTATHDDDGQAEFLKSSFSSSIGLAVPAERSDAVEQKVLRDGRRELLQGMTHYGQQPNWKGTFEFAFL